MDGSQNLDASTYNEETLTINEIDKRVLVAADFLKGMDSLSGSVTVDEQGKIIGADEQTVVLGGDLHFSTQREALINKFKTGNESCAKDFQEDPAVIDTRVVNGCVVVIHDSSKALPHEVSAAAKRGDYGGPTDFWTKNKAGQGIKLNRLGLITIDLNQAKRADGVKASTTLQHELSHHNLMMTDYLMATDPQLKMHSTCRQGRSAALFGVGKDLMTSTEAFAADLPTYELILGRSRDEITERDLDCQQGYLDELHSSLLQRKENWVNATEDVYNNRDQKGKPWEVVGSNPDDQEAAKGVLRLVQAVYLTELMVQTFTKQATLGEGQRLLLQQVPELMTTMCAIIGTSRSVNQAERLLAIKWKEFSNSEWGKKLINSQAFAQWREQICQTGWADQGLKDLFTQE